MMLAPGGEEAALSREAIETHHMLPQAFKAFFERAGLDIEKYTVRMSRADHRLLPEGLHTSSGGNWNERWQQFFRAHSEGATKREILNFLDKLKKDFKISVKVKKAKH